MQGTTHDLNFEQVSDGEDSKPAKPKQNKNQNQRDKTKVF